MTTELRDSLRDLADERAADVDLHLPPSADVLWSAGVRRRRTSRMLTVGGAALLTLVLVGLGALLTGGLRGLPSLTPAAADDPAATELMSFPDYVPKPLRIADLADRPGLRTAAITDGQDGGVFLVDQVGSVTTVGPAAAETAGPAALSPDGRWFSRGFDIVDLLSGEALQYDIRGEVAHQRTMVSYPAPWTPASTRAYIDSVNQGDPESMGIVVDTATGRTSAVPLIRVRERVDVQASGGMAGWLDDDTLLAFVPAGDGHLQGWTWRLGDAQWTPSQLRLAWDRSAADSAGTSVSLTPDRSALLVGASGDASAAQLLLFDAVTGALLETVATGDRAAGQTQPCAPAFRDGRPVLTQDGAARLASEGEEIMVVSDRYAAACIAFAGNDIQGQPLDRSWARVSEYLWLGIPVLLGAGVLLGTILIRRRNTAHPA
ncbi:MAG: hypothetical protein Q4G67_13010 [Actinomycetia bacterium]|nr:hypothetical protein [Actinomycetes bacterium]